MSRPPLVTLREPSRPLYVFTAATIVAGIAALAWATAAVPIAPGIGLHAPELTGTDPVGAGLVFWVCLGLTGSMRASSIDGHAVVTFHLPFIVAAALLGGPVAGGWVAFVSTIELRELREVPWYGVLANHASQALAAVLAGLAAAAALRVGLAWAVPAAAELVAAVVASAVLGAVAVAVAAVTIGLRERLTPRETLLVFSGSWRRTLLAECVVAWVLAFAYQGMGWWAPVVCVALVLLAWEAHDDRERIAHDEMTGLLNRHGLMLHLAAAVARLRRTGVGSLLVMLDLDGFKAINDTYGHPAGDEVLQVVGERLNASIRITDAAARVGGDEFLLLLPGIRDVATAEARARQIHARLAEPILVDGHVVRVGASLGLVLIDGHPFVPTLRLLAEADRAMYAAKRAGGGVRFGGFEPANRSASP